MKNVRWLAAGGAAVAAAAALTLGLGGFASAGPVGTNAQNGPPVGASEGAAAATATSPALSHFTLAASAFGPDGSHTTNSQWLNLWNPSTLTNTTPGRCFDAGVTLPATASIKSVTFYYTHGNGTLQAQLNKQALSTHSAATLAAVDVPPMTGTPVYTKITGKVTSGKIISSDGYSLGVCFHGSTTFSGATVNYTG